MYTDHFGLTESPFSIAPNPQYLFMSRLHREALAHLLYGIQADGGFILLTGEVGTGKTTLCRCLLEQIPTDIDIAFVLNPRVSAEELLATICDEFGVSYRENASLKHYTDQLNSFLLDQHRADKRAVLIIDEAQNLSQDVLEQVRLLTNLETNERKLLQIILLGQPELLVTLTDPNLRQFNQRITARYHLDALDRQDTSDYVSHRLHVAGGEPSIFSSSALNRIYKLSQGIPRVINLVCDRAMLGAYSADKARITTQIVNRAADEVLGTQSRLPSFPWAMASGVLLLVATSAVYVQTRTEAPTGNPTNKPQVTQAETSTEMNTVKMSTNPQPSSPPVHGHASLTEAYHDLIALWGAAFEDRITNPCELIGNIGLRCMKTQVSMTDLLTIDRPVIIEIEGSYVTLSEANDSHITLFAGSEQYDLEREDFSQRFDGHINLIWRTPPDYRAPIRVHDKGAAVDWLVMQLAIINGNSPPLETGFTYDALLESEVREFQASVGLAPDGIVDAMTWIHINSVEAINIPTLRGNRG